MSLFTGMYPWKSAGRLETLVFFTAMLVTPTIRYILPAEPIEPTEPTEPTTTSPQ